MGACDDTGVESCDNDVFSTSEDEGMQGMEGGTEDGLGSTSFIFDRNPDIELNVDTTKTTRFFDPMSP
jgi:hypothetical protein